MSFVTIWLPPLAGFAIFLLRVKELGTKRKRVDGPVQEKLTFFLFLSAGTLLLAGSMFEYWYRGEHLRWGTFLPGVLCATASFVLRRKAIAALGEFWSLHIEIREAHAFVKSGPFRWMRHPTYFSMILEMLAGALVMNAPLALLASLLIFFPTLYYRVKMEEAALIAKFGAGYQTYRERTPAIIPYKIPQAQ
ncbi:MAG: isoprenylcysteine carboxylmethyltransferase family protein [Verrucomicrobiota bacterium]